MVTSSGGVTGTDQKNYISNQDGSIKDIKLQLHRPTSKRDSVVGWCIMVKKFYEY